MLDEAERESETLAYSVDQECEPFWTSAKDNHHCCIMPVFDTNDMPIGPNRFAEKLVNAMCEITFVLKHITIAQHRKADGSVVDGNDVFSAQVETVAILKNPPILTRSPYKGRLTRKPQHHPQLPTRQEQVNATMAFVPHPSFGQMFPGPSQSMASVMPSLVAHETAPVTMTNLASPGETVTGIKPQGDVTVFE